MNKRNTGILIFIIWCLAAVYGAINHELWRDEMRALSIAREAPSVFHLPGFLLNEGHPLLWYTLLKVFYFIFGSNLILPVLSLLFAAAIAWLLLIRSNLPLLLSVLIVFGPWCLYDYGINCRNYGIAAFFFLLFADFYLRKPDKHVVHFAILALAAQTNIYAAMMSVLIGLWLLSETNFKKGNIGKHLTGFGILTASFLLTVYVTLPGNDSLFISDARPDRELIKKIWDTGYGFTGLFYPLLSDNVRQITIILWLSILAFIPKPKSMLILASALLAMTFFSLNYRMNFIQHQGMWIYTYLTLFWINYKEIYAFWGSKNRVKYLGYCGIAMFAFVLAVNLGRTKVDYFNDINGIKSDSKDAGKWFKENLRKNDIIISEPDYIMESVMYYTYHPFYLAREKVFNSFVHFTKDNAELMSLNKLEHIADSFNTTGRTTYLVLGKNFTRDTIYRYSYGKQFIADSSAIARLQSGYQLMESFNNNWYCDEHYFIYKHRSF